MDHAYDYPPEVLGPRPGEPADWGLDYGDEEED
jgi:hypothetical protein